MYVLKDVPPEFWPLVREYGFRPAKKSPNWYRWYDNRLRHTIADRLAAEAMLERRAIVYEIKPMRSTRRRVGKTNTPSAARWLAERNKHLGAG